MKRLLSVSIFLLLTSCAATEACVTISEDRQKYTVDGDGSVEF